LHKEEATKTVSRQMQRKKALYQLRFAVFFSFLLASKRKREAGIFLASLFLFIDFDPVADSQPG